MTTTEAYRRFAARENRAGLLPADAIIAANGADLFSATCVALVILSGLLPVCATDADLTAAARAGRDAVIAQGDSLDFAAWYLAVSVYRECVGPLNIDYPEDMAAATRN